MLHELDVLEARRIAELAGAVHAVRDRLLEKVPEAKLGEAPPARGIHDPVSALDLDPLLTGTPEFAALRDALTTLPRETREKLWAIAQCGAAGFGNGQIEPALVEAAGMSDTAVDGSLLGEPALQRLLAKGLYRLGLAAAPTD